MLQHKMMQCHNLKHFFFSNTAQCKVKMEREKGDFKENIKNVIMARTQEDQMLLLTLQPDICMECYSVMLLWHGRQIEIKQPA